MHFHPFHPNKPLTDNQAEELDCLGNFDWSYYQTSKPIDVDRLTTDIAYRNDQLEQGIVVRSGSHEAKASILHSKRIPLNFLMNILTANYQGKAPYATNVLDEAKAKQYAVHLLQTVLEDDATDCYFINYTFDYTLRVDEKDIIASPTPFFIYAYLGIYEPGTQRWTELILGGEE